MFDASLVAVLGSASLISESMILLIFKLLTP